MNARDGRAAALARRDLLGAGAGLLAVALVRAGSR